RGHEQGVVAPGVHRPHRVVAAIAIQIQPARDADRVLGDEPTERGVVIPVLQVLQPQSRLGGTGVLGLVAEIAAELEGAGGGAIRAPGGRAGPEGIVAEHGGEGVAGAVGAIAAAADAMVAALTLAWSKGPVEAQTNRLNL